MKLFSKIKNFFWPTKENNNQPLILTDRAISVLILFFLLVKVLFSFEILILRQTSLFAEVSAQKILELTNDLRKQYGLPPLNENPLLKEAAKEKALDMIRNKYFAHYSPTGISPWYFIEKNGYDYRYAGENLAINFIDSEEVVKAWFNSPTHRDNLLNQKYEEIGIAVLTGDILGNNNNTIVVVQMFGTQFKKPILTKIAQAEETTTSFITSTTLKSPATTLKPVVYSQEKERSEVKKPTTTLVLTTTTIIPITTTTTKETPSTIAPSQASVETTISTTSHTLEQKENLLKQEQLDKFIGQKSNREKLNLLNQILAFSLIIFGTVVLIGIIGFQRQGVTSLVYSELIMRGVLIVLIGFAFFLFKLELFVGHLIIA